MASENTKDEKKSGAPGTVSLPEVLTHLIEDEAACLTRAPGTGEVKPRVIDPNEKPRTAGARTAGG